MESSPKKAPRNKFPALLVVALALVALVFVIWRVDSAPSTTCHYQWSGCWRSFMKN